MTPSRTAVRCATLLGLSLGCFTLGLPAQAPPPRPLGPIVATFADSIARGSVLRALSDGRVLLNDPIARRIVLLDGGLAHPTLVADTTSATSKAYGTALTGLVPFTGDSSLTVDLTTRAGVLIAPDGKIARIIQRPRQFSLSIDATFVEPVAYDQAGHFLSRPPAPYYLGLLSPDFVGDTLMVGPDSVPLLREDVTARRIDTLVMLRNVRHRQAVSRPAPGRGSGRPALNPMPSGDDWTVLNDGTVAVVRAADYHIDWIGPDKRVVSTPKLPVQRTPVSAERKRAIIDSVRANMARTGGAPQAVVEPSDLPDFVPLFVPGSARADAAGNVWVRENRVGLVYDVIGRDGKLADRLMIPDGWAIAGFGPGAVFLMRGTGRMAQLAKATLR